MNPSCHAKPARAFVAVPLPQILIERLKQIQQQLQSGAGGAAVRWTKPAQLHVTLEFLGNVAGDALNDLKSALRNACKDQAPFRLALEKPGCFPNTRNPRVIWVGVGGELEPLQKLQTQIDRETRTFGDHTEEHAFQPHLTIGRVNARAIQAKQVGRAIEQASVGRVGAWTVSEIELMQSRLSPQGAQYTTLATLALSSPLLEVKER
jgi:RNA 2',3'-cyclic 3'-phosphodiesterase